MRTLPLLLLLVACEHGGTLTIDESPAGGDDSRPEDTTEPPADDTTPAESDAPADDTTPAEADPLGDLAQEGGAAPRTDTGRFRADGCTLEWTKFEPDGGSPYGFAVILSHGFMRGPDQMRGWARHLASWGFTVYTPALCHSSVIGVDHAQNGRDLAAFGDSLGVPVIYAGHSAGGLASQQASLHDPDALGVLGLDLVDVFDLGLGDARRVTAPMYDIVGEPSRSCNDNGNGVPVTRRAAEHALVRITGATHCDFENPTNTSCTALCGWAGAGPSDARQADAIAALMTGFVFAFGVGDARGLEVWTEGTAAWQDLADAGLVTAL